MSRYAIGNFYMWNRAPSKDLNNKPIKVEEMVRQSNAPSLPAQYQSESGKTTDSGITFLQKSINLADKRDKPRYGSTVQQSAAASVGGYNIKQVKPKGKRLGLFQGLN